MPADGIGASLTPIDALAVARAVLREPDLPVATHDTVSRELKLLIDRRDDLVAQRTSITNRFLNRVHELDPARNPKKRSMDRAKTHKSLADWLSALDGVLAEVAADELADIVRLTAMINALTQRIGAAVQAVAPSLLALPGCGGAHRSQAGRRIRRRQPIHQRSRFRPSQRQRAHPCLVRQHRWSNASQQVRQPPTQRRPAPHCHHSDRHDLKRWTGLLPKTTCRR